MHPFASRLTSRERSGPPRLSLLDPALLFVLIGVVFLAASALSMDVARTAYGIKGDEASYVTMALSLAYDGDLTYQERDLSRFWRVYQRGPEGIFLKRGADLDLAIDGSWPFLGISAAPIPDADRLYFGKAFIYPLVAAPFARLAGLNGMLVLHVLLLGGVFICCYAFARERTTPANALLLSTGFLGASIAPLYAVWLTPEIFNFALVCYAYFLWLYKEVRSPAEPTARGLLGPGSDLLAAALLGLVTFSKPSNALLILPLAALAAWRRWGHAVRVGLVFGIVALGCFVVNAMVSGELNYQGGDRKTFYGRFPFDSPVSSFDALGISVSTNELDQLAVEESGGAQLRHNTVYFLFGRHFGLVPYYFPGVVIVTWALWRRRRLTLWHGLVGAAVAATSVILLVMLPNTWSGGGGPPGNRYFLSIYPALFFLMPPGSSMVPGLIAWGGGALFTSHILINPFVAANRPWHNTEEGLVRLLPVELTMVNDLPVRLDQGRSRIPSREDPSLLLYFLDENAARPDESGIWIAGEARAEIIVRTQNRIEFLKVTLNTPIANRVTVSAGGAGRTLDLRPNVPATIELPVRAVYSRGAENFVLSVETEAGFVPRLEHPPSNDGRFLGVAVKLEGVPPRVHTP